MIPPAPPGPASDDAPRRPGARLATLAFWRDLAVLSGLVILGLSVGASLLIPLFFALLLFVLLTAVIDWIGGLSLAGMRWRGWWRWSAMATRRWSNGNWPGWI